MPKVLRSFWVISSEAKSEIAQEMPIKIDISRDLDGKIIQIIDSG